jgi:hypothetical protein
MGRFAERTAALAIDIVVVTWRAPALRLDVVVSAAA